MRAFASMLGLALVGLAAAGPTSGSEKLHEQMTLDEIKQVFNAEPHAVPEYDVIPIHWPGLHKRSDESSTTIHVNAFGHNIKLFLNPTDGILIDKNTPVYLAKSSPEHQLGMNVVEVADAMAEIGQMMEDREKKASLMVKKGADGRTRISGHIASEGWVVKPMPMHLSDQLNNRRLSSSADDVGEHIPIALSDEHAPIPEYHVVYKTPELPQAIDYAAMPFQDHLINKREEKRIVPEIVYPQVLNMIDHKTYKLFDENINDLLEYLVTFWNGVDLRYRTLESPKVRLNIAGVVIAEDATALPFIANNELGGQYLNIFGALDALGKFMPTANVYFPNDTYDMTVAISQNIMCSPTPENTCELGTLGLAYQGGACWIDETMKSLSVAVIHDAGAYDGMHSAAHEIGHLFGSDHDGGKGIPCLTEDGNIMAPWPVLNENSNDWSKCTLKAFDKFFKATYSQCVDNLPKTSALPRTLPGRIMTMDQQCEKFQGTKACNTNSPHICRHLTCISKTNSNLCEEVIDAPADGSECGKGKICLHGQCLSVKDFD